MSVIDCEVKDCKGTPETSMHFGDRTFTLCHEHLLSGARFAKCGESVSVLIVNNSEDCCLASDCAKRAQVFITIDGSPWIQLCMYHWRIGANVRLHGPSTKGVLSKIVHKSGPAQPLRPAKSKKRK